MKISNRLAKQCLLSRVTATISSQKHAITPQTSLVGLQSGMRTFSVSVPSKGDFYNILQESDLRKELRETFEKFAIEECAPLAEKMEKENTFPHEMWKKMGDIGLLGMTVEEEYGGMGLGYYEHCIATEELSKANAALALSYIAHSNLCVN